MIRNLINQSIALFERIPYDVIAILSRIGIGTVFFRPGLLKVEGWSSGTTVALFREEYKLPLISPELAAYMGTAMELAMPILLFVGLFTRFAAFALLIMTLVIQIFVYPNAFDTHATWAVCFLILIKYGAGTFSLDHLIKRMS
jgi:putative oxidoreductase